MVKIKNLPKSTSVGCAMIVNWKFSANVFATTPAPYYSSIKIQFEKTFTETDEEE